MQNQWVLMPRNYGWYAFCGVFETIMFKCEDDKNYFFDTTNNQCKYNCPAVANYPDRTNCTNYISCNWVNGAYQVSTITCPPTYKWDDNAKSCAPMGSTTCTPEISTPAPPTSSGPPATDAPVTKPPPATDAPVTKPPPASTETGGNKGKATGT